MKSVTVQYATALAVLLSAGTADAAPKRVGLNIHQSQDIGLPVASACGAGIVRIDFNWFNIETSQGNYDFARFDQLIDDAVSRNLTVLATVGYTPAWASSGNGDGEDTLNDVPNPGLFEAFVTAAVQRYSDRVKHWELWNEPNLDGFFEGGIDEYVDLILLPGAAAVHTSCSDCKVLGPDVATIGEDYDDWMIEAFERGGDDIDIVSAHIYSGFTDLGAATTDATFFSKLEDHRKLYVGQTMVYEDPLSIRECMTAHGMSGKPLWMTETGKRAAYADAEATAEQVVYVRHVIEAMLVRPWWEATVFYEAFDMPGEDYLWGFALHDPSVPEGFVQKPVCGVLKNAVDQQPALGGNGTDCTDGLDNEGDGKIDFPADPDCTSASGTSEGVPPVDAGVPSDAEPEDGGGGAVAIDDESSGCACGVEGGSEEGAASLLLAGLAVLLSRRRRRSAC